jgi:hypothetical protein
MSNYETSGTPEGWKRRDTSSAAPWHYFVHGLSLCGRWENFAWGVSSRQDDSPGNCKRCCARLAARRRRLLAKQEATP